MATVREPLLLAISSPRKGALWEAYRAHYGQDSDVLVWQAATRAMNPTVPQAFIDSELQKDEASARAEYLALFRVDIESFLSREIIQGCIEPGRHSRPPLDGVSYTAFVDPSGGVGDSFALAIAHQEGDDVVLDLVHERRAPLSPEQTVEEFVFLLKTYRVRGVTGDRYSEEFARELFRKHGVDYSVSPWSRSDLFVETLPMLTSRRARLLDDERLVAQLLSLERRTGGSGKDMITHPRDGHDDVANAAAGALVHMGRQGQLGFTDWTDKYRYKRPESQRPVVGVEVFETVWHSCPARCGWQSTAGPIDPKTCPKCHPRGPTWQQVVRGFCAWISQRQVRVVSRTVVRRTQFELALEQGP